jgi:Domain of unknown function (DUF5069)
VEEIVPLISSSSMGPLGIAHLPRLWLKVLLHAYGRLPEGYRHGTGGFDEAIFDNLGIDGAAFVAFVESEKPDYLALEAWVSKNATKLDPASIHAHNQFILHRNMREPLASERRARFKISDENYANGVRLNDLDDWAGVHEQLAGQPKA